MLNTIKKDLKDYELLSILDNTELEEVISNFHRKQYKKGQVLFMDGDSRKRIYFLEKGYVRIEKSDLNDCYTYYDYIKPYLMFPFAGIFQDEYYQYTCEAVTDATVFYINVDVLEKLLSDNPKAMIYITKSLTRLIRLQESRVQKLSNQIASERVIQSVKYLAENLGSKKGNEIIIDCPLTAKDISNFSSTSRETVSHVLKQMKEDNIIQMKNKKTYIYNQNYFGNIHLHQHLVD
jgi:CRP-like cAMP-binding protein